MATLFPHVPQATPPLTATPALVARAGHAVLVSSDGEAETCTALRAAKVLRRGPVLLCHARETARRLGLRAGDLPASPFDLLELFAFVHPARFCLPTPRGLAAALALDPPDSAEEQAALLHHAAANLLARLADPALAGRAETAAIAVTMAGAGWAWGPAVCAALGVEPAAQARPAAGLDIWNRLPEWEERPPAPPPGSRRIVAAAVAKRLADLLGPAAEARSGQRAFARAAASAFAPRDGAGHPHVVLAEAGTGIGKTLGYIAPASLWAETNGGTVWLSTHTKNLQRQIDQELDRLYPDPATKRRRAVLRKGRENYLCLLNFQGAAMRAASGGGADLVTLGLVARWARHSRDGDMVGGDFPSWLEHLRGRGLVAALTDHRGECVHSACPHYRRCVIERVTRRARHADLVVANHALVLTQAARHAATDEPLPPDARERPLRVVFDEGHHLFAAADSAFATRLSGAEAAELRRWLRGAEQGRGWQGGRRRGLAERTGDLIAGHKAAEAALAAALRAAADLPAEGWLGRIMAEAPHGPAEDFLALVREQVSTRAVGSSGHDIEAEIWPPVPGLIAAAERLAHSLARLEEALAVLAGALLRRLAEEAATLDAATRARIEAAARGIARRARGLVAAWRSMLAALSGETPEDFVDWLAITRIEGREVDVGLHRHWLDPTRPLAESVLREAHGVLITSATLRDTAPDLPDDWQNAEMRTGAAHLPLPAPRHALASPFDHAAQTRVMVVTDVPRHDAEAVAGAYRDLFLAAGGGALGLFTAIGRLRAVHALLVGPLDAAGIPLYAQHVDAIDTGTLVDIFRAELDACLLGTDAVRDGVDVPGRALRLIVFDRVPWPRPNILHKARRRAFGGSAYDDMLVRFKLKQAYGRLLRRADDHGVFVMLDSAMPSRLTTAFPPGVAVERLDLAQAVAATRAFLSA